MHLGSNKLKTGTYRNRGNIYFKNSVMNKEKSKRLTDTGTLNGMALIQTGSSGEGPHPINSLKNEQSRGYVVAI